MMKITILYGTETGNAEGLANDAGTRLKSMGYSVEVHGMEDYEEAVMLKSCGVLLVVTSTWGDGEPPSNAESLYLSLKDSSEDLSDIQYAVYALGDETFDRFCQAGKDFDQFLNRCGAKRLLPIRTCGDDYDSDFPEWLDELIPLLSK